MSKIKAIFFCGYPDCDLQSDPVDTDEIDRYDYHDAPMRAMQMNEPSGWWWDTFYDWVGCPEHAEEMRNTRDSKRWNR
jgi:hypothetical protein